MFGIKMLFGRCDDRRFDDRVDAWERFFFISFQTVEHWKLVRDTDTGRMQFLQNQCHLLQLVLTRVRVDEGDFLLDELGDFRAAGFVEHKKAGRQIEVGNFILDFMFGGWGIKRVTKSTFDPQNRFAIDEIIAIADAVGQILAR